MKIFKNLLLVFLLCSVPALANAGAKPVSFVKLVDNKITFSTDTTADTDVQINAENISKRVAKKITPETTFSSTALPKVSIKISPNEKVTTPKKIVSVVFRLKSSSGKTLSITLDNVKIKKDSTLLGLLINVPSDSSDTYEDDLIAFTYKTPSGFTLNGSIGNDKDTGPVLTNGTDTISFDTMVFKNKVIDKYKSWGISDIDLTGSPAYSFIIKGTYLAIEIESGKFKPINSISGKITVQ